MAITRRTSAAYSSFIAVTNLCNNSHQDGKNSRGSIGWYENDPNIINRSNQNPFSDYPRHGRRSTEISELPKIFVEDDNHDTIISLTSDTREDPIKPADINDREIEEIIESGANLIEANATLISNPNNETTSCMLYENPLSDEFSDVISKPTSKIPFDLFEHQNELTRRWSVSNLSYDCDKNRCNDRLNQEEQTSFYHHQYHPHHNQSITEDANPTKWIGIANTHHCHLAYICSEKRVENSVSKKENTSKCLKRLCSLPDYQNFSSHSGSLKLLSKKDALEECKVTSEMVPLLTSKNVSNVKKVEKYNNTNIGSCKESALQHSRKIQSMTDKTDASIRHHSEHNKSLPDIGNFS